MLTIPRRVALSAEWIDNTKKKFKKIHKRVREGRIGTWSPTHNYKHNNYNSAVDLQQENWEEILANILCSNNSIFANQEWAVEDVSSQSYCRLLIITRRWHDLYFNPKSILTAVAFHQTPFHCVQLTASVILVIQLCAISCTCSDTLIYTYILREYR